MVNKFADDDLQIDSDKAYYIGDKNTDGSWRFIIDGDYLNIEKRESDVWEVKDTIGSS